jgi:hypothetical protein
MTEKKTRSRKPRAKKAPVKVVADTPNLDVEKLVEDGFEKTRTRDEAGHFVQDDPSTPENEAWEWQKKEESAPVVEETVPVPVPVVEEPVVVKEEPEVKSEVLSYSGATKVEDIGCRFKRKRAIRRQSR